MSISDPHKDKEREATRLTPTMEYGSYVYDTRNSKSLAQLTREALPRAEHYRDLVQGKHGCRPTLEELHEARFLEKVRGPLHLHTIRPLYSTSRASHWFGVAGILTPIPRPSHVSYPPPLYPTDSYLSPFLAKLPRRRNFTTPPPSADSYSPHP